jgi:hypothetical protein
LGQGTPQTAALRLKSRAFMLQFDIRNAGFMLLGGSLVASVDKKGGCF